MDSRPRLKGLIALIVVLAGIAMAVYYGPSYWAAIATFLGGLYYAVSRRDRAS